MSSTRSGSASASERERLIAKLRSIARLEVADIEALQALPMRFADLPANHDIVSEGDRPTDCCLLVAGFACRYKIIEDGKRQILSFHLPGDIPDVQSLHIEVMDHSLGTMAPSRVAFIAHSDLHRMTHDFPNLAAVFWRETLIDAAVFREWIVGLGRRDAYQNLAHLFCEMRTRFEAVGMLEGDSFNFPVTQTDLADATGLSTVHLNRTLMQLRAEKLITLQSARLIIHDWQGLQAAACFDPRYLHLRRGGKTA